VNFRKLLFKSDKKKLSFRRVESTQSKKVELTGVGNRSQINADDTIVL